MPTSNSREPFDIGRLSRAYAAGELTPAGVLADVRRRIAEQGERPVWIDVLPATDIDAQLAAATARRDAGEPQPLWGIPFAVKDNIDVAGRPTTAGCPEFAYAPALSNTAVQKLCDAGAIVVGKTNLDQFATGLVGVRSPYGACHNSFKPGYISGGSSSGSAIAVATGLVSFALGTDTAGSGRVPASFNNIVGLKPSRGKLSTAGVVPACRSLDCVSVFALTCEDAKLVSSIAGGFDAGDIYSRTAEELARLAPPGPAGDGPFRLGLPREDQLQFFGNAEGLPLFRAAVERLKSLGAVVTEIDFQPFIETARLLYEGPWVAERMAAVKDFLASHAAALLPVTRSIIERANGFSAVDAFQAGYALKKLRRQAGVQWQAMDLLAVPTAGRCYTIAEVEADPIKLNTNLGYYTNFTNLLDLCGVAVPSGFQAGGLPFGITLLAPAGCDDRVLRVGQRFQQSTNLTLGATGWPTPEPTLPGVVPSTSKRIGLAVLGAHLAGQPLNHQLTSLGGTLARVCKTSAHYRFFALPGTVPPKPGLIRVPPVGETTLGSPIDVEVWDLSAEAFGAFVAAIPPPLGVGTIELEDGGWVKGFLCEEHATRSARDITSFGGWRQFLVAER